MEQAGLAGAVAHDHQEHAGTSAEVPAAANTTNSSQEGIVLNLTPQKERAIDELLSRVRVISEAGWTSKQKSTNILKLLQKKAELGLISRFKFRVTMNCSSSLFLLFLAFFSRPSVHAVKMLCTWVAEYEMFEDMPPEFHYTGQSWRDFCYSRAKLASAMLLDLQPAVSHTVVGELMNGQVLAVATVYAEMLQVATATGDVYVFDLLSAPGLMNEGRLRELLESERVPKWPLPSLHERPLTRIPVYSAAYMAACLVPNVYTALSGAIKPEYQPLVKLLSEERLLFHLVPDLVRKFKQQRHQEHLRKQLAEAARTDTKLLLTNQEKRLFNELKLGAEASKLVAGHTDVSRKRIHPFTYEVPLNVGAGTKRVKVAEESERPSVRDAASQTASTGDVYITKAFFQEESLN
ncbi:hypothetical protein HPB48_001520 [Haemaphysalis longicornis]|uniref:Uncharacterized protein n=1 Tax=Haemaphysalis longicornis TaxID=44386 RepID=A0A9J6GZ42_HAELO|nr:hypothetical protein HPB48_001520 [Haemaphysalis longicornis]